MRETLGSLVSAHHHQDGARAPRVQRGHDKRPDRGHDTERHVVAAIELLERRAHELAGEELLLQFVD